MPIEESTLEHEPSSLIAHLLDEQQSTAAVHFSEWHDQHSTGYCGGGARSEHSVGLDEQSVASRYRQLIPLNQPRPGEQYAFDVDLDVCSGCKACVAACNKLNGLEADETWRSVGLLVGGAGALPVVQHVTTSCHHCLEPACLAGCPVKAYDKDPTTGIVRHLDDQCIGCQYCIFKCPYDVPQYVPSRGIVRKCDMCQDRLAVGEAPACVQSCPNQAIRIVCVDQSSVVDACETGLFLPGSPEPSYTLPTTSFRSTRAFPRNLRPADYFAVHRQHSHLPLVAMLVLTQMSVGAFIVGIILDQRALAQTVATPGAKLGHAICSLLVGGCGMVAAVGHLGRPLWAFRAWVGLRTSWMSREILAFGLFPLFAALYAGSVALLPSSSRAPGLFGTLAAIAGIVGVGCSAMIYIDTHRPTWRATATWPKFLLTTALLGLAAGMAIDVSLAIAARRSFVAAWRHDLRMHSAAIVAVTLLKLAFELSTLVHHWDRNYTVERRAALLLTGELRPTLIIRVLLAIVGGVLLPGLVAIEPALRGAEGFGAAFIGSTMLMSVAMLTLGELFERHLYFAAAVAPRMPGGLK